MDNPAAQREIRGSAVLAAGFATAIAMWTIGYLARLPGVLLPGPALLALLLGAVVVGGLLLGRNPSRGWRDGLFAGALTGVLNLLVLGSLLGGERPDQLVPSALWWVPGSILITAVVAAAGAAAGRRVPARRPVRDWLGVYLASCIAATLLLLGVGGVVTSAEAGLAVADWPTSYGYNMFLYPLSRMTGGIYYEHAHRLIGALVGLAVLVLAFYLPRLESRGWVRGLAWLALLLVIAQGILGGLRVTERSLALAMVHGVLGQLFLAVLVSLAIFVSPSWRRADAGGVRPGAGADRLLVRLLLLSLVAQLVLGAGQRHFHALLMTHISLGILIVGPLALIAGLRAWGDRSGATLLRRSGLGLAVAATLQIVSGLGAWWVKTGIAHGALSPRFDLVVSTLHQWMGAVLLALGVTVMWWTLRLVHEPTEALSAS